MAVSLYKATSCFPREEQYGPTSQLRRAGVAVASNIADGWDANQMVDTDTFLESRAGNLELQTQLTIARQLGFGDKAALDTAEALSTEVSKM